MTLAWAILTRYRNNIPRAVNEVIDNRNMRFMPQALFTLRRAGFSKQWLREFIICTEVPGSLGMAFNLSQTQLTALRAQINSMQ